MKIEILPCLTTQSELLRKIARETFLDTYAWMNNRQNMDAYIETAFSREAISSELHNRCSRFYILYADKKPAGYMKINDGPGQTEFQDPGSLELERVYIRKAFKNMGIGRKAVDYVVQLAVEMKKQHVWLGVWEENMDAIGFYMKLGFQPAGEHMFKLGEQDQKDLILKKNLY